MSGGGDTPLTCDMNKDCTRAVTHIDDKGFTYCHNHGESRKNWGTARCRKLRTHELNRLLKGQQIAHY